MDARNVKTPVADAAPRHRSGTRGFTLLEMLISLGLAAVIFSMALAAFQHVARVGGDLSARLKGDDERRTLPLLMDRWISPSGNHRFATGVEGVVLEEGELRLSADLIGRRGFPDGRLDDSFERIGISRRTTQLRLRSGRGTPQAFLEGVESWEVVRPNPHQIRLELGLFVDRRAAAGSGRLSSHLHLIYSLPNSRTNLFAEAWP